MAQEIGAAYVTLLPSARGFGKAVEGEMSGAYGTAEKQGRGFFSRLGGLAKGFGLAVGAAVGVVGALAAKGGISRALNIEDAQAKLRGLGHDTKNIEAIMSDALASVRGTAFGLDTAATVASTAVAAGIKPGQELEKYLRLTADAATIAGVSMEEMGSILNKATTAGKVYTQELNQLADRGLPIFQWLQEEYQVSAEELRKMVAAGKVDAETFRRVIEENIGGAALASGDTTRGAFANMRAALSRLGAAFAGPALESAKGFFNEMIIVFDGITERAQPLVQAFASFLDTRDLEGFGNRVVQYVDKATDAISGLYSLMVRGDFTSQLRDAFGWEEDSAPVGYLLRLRDSLVRIYEAVGPLAGAMQTVLGPSLLALGDAVAPVLPTLSESLADAVEELAPALAEVLPSLVELVPLLADLAVDILPPLVAGLSALVPLMKEALGSLGLSLDVIGIGLGALSGDSSMAESLTEIEDIWKRLGGIGDFSRDVFNTAVGYVQGVRSFVLGVVGALRSVVDTVEGWITGTIEGIKAGIADLGLTLGGIVMMIAGVFSGDSDLIAQGVARLRDMLVQVWTDIRDQVIATVEGLWGNVVAKFSSGVSDAVGQVETLPAKILATFSNAGTLLFSAGQNIIQGLISGITSKAIEAANAAKAVAADAVSGVKDFLGIKSPSRVFRDEVGAMIGAGLIEGLEGSRAEVTASVMHLVEVPQIGTGRAGGGSGITQYITVTDQDPRIMGRVMGRELLAEMAGGM